MTSRVDVGTSRSRSGPSDEALIQGFVDNFLQGHTTLLSNQNLRTEPLFDSVQLLSPKEGVVATAKIKDTPIKMIVRHHTRYLEPLHRYLMARSFYPLLKAAQERCYAYCFCEAPEGWRLYCTTAQELWRACWGRGFGVRSGIPLDLLIWCKGPAGTKESWYPLRGMDCENAQLMIKMLGWTETLDGTDLVVWTRQDQDSSHSGSVAAAKPGLRSSVRFRQ